MTKPLMFLIDLDGTLADNSHREHYLKQDPADWDAFFSDPEVMKDVPIPEALAHFKDGQFIHGEAMFLTSRAESSRGVSRAWLIENGFSGDPSTPLIMKPDILKRLRAKHFKPAAMLSLQGQLPDHQLVLIDDYIEVLDSLEKTPHLALRAPECWTTTDWSNVAESAWWHGREESEGLFPTRARRIRDGISLLMNYEECSVDAQHDTIYAGCKDPTKVDDKDRERLEALKWSWDAEQDCWFFFT